MQERFTSADKALTKSFKDAVREIGLCVCVCGGMTRQRKGHVVVVAVVAVAESTN